MNCKSEILQNNVHNNMKLMILGKNQGNSHMLFQPAHSECIFRYDMSAQKHQVILLNRSDYLLNR